MVKKRALGIKTDKEVSPGVRSRNLFDPSSPEPYKLSRSKLELFLQCPRCFYLDRRSGIGRPQGPAFTLNVAVDALLKCEFDYHRARGEPHALMTEFGVDAVPYRHAELDTWRHNFTGVRVLHPDTNFLFYGAVDDIWQSPDGQLHVVDYKATSSARAITLDGPWKEAYKRQMEMYQWLLRGNGLPVSDAGYFVYVNADPSAKLNAEGAKDHFGGRLEFAMQVIAYAGDDSWVSDALMEAHTCLCRDMPPVPAPGCEWCAYRREAGKAEQGTNDDRA